MSINLTRRFFLIGSAAAIAAASAPIIAAEPFAPIQPVPALVPFVKRVITGIEAYSDSNEPTMLRMMRNNETPIHVAGIGPHGCYRWSAFDKLHGLFVTPAHTIQLRVEPATSLGRINLCCYDWLDGECDPIAVSEQHDFSRSGPAIILPLDIRDAERFAKHCARMPLLSEPALQFPRSPSRICHG